MKLEFRLLGDVAVLVDGRPLDLGATRQRSILALLVLQRDRAIATELLADRLWPDEQPLSAIKTIQVYVSRLRRVLGPAAGRLASTGTGYRLSVADDELDAARFERGLRQAREALAAGSPETATATLEAILALWTGPALGDLAGEPFARREADRLEELRLQASEELFELRIGAGMGRGTIADLRRLLADQPERERLWRLLMLALYADGRQAEALAAYQDARRYLADELGLDPGPELIDLERAILSQEAPRPSKPGLASAPPDGDAVDTLDRVSAPIATVAPLTRRRRVVTVLRVDLVAAEGVDDPEILETRERRDAEVVRRAVERHGGTIDRADGTGVTAVFGLTVAREDDALRAVRAAVELRDGSASDGADGLAPRFGISTGEVLPGRDDARTPTLAGAPLQMAGRLAGHAGAREVLLAPETERLVRGHASTETVAPRAGAFRLVTFTDGEAIARRPDSAFVGRTVELDGLVDAFERVVAAGMPGLVTVIGAPGVGKSRLAAETFARIVGRATILRSRCLPYGEGITYLPIRELVLAASDIGSGEPRDEALAKLDAVVAAGDRADVVRNRIAAVVGLADDAVPGEEIPWAVRRFFESLARERPLVLVVDDLQWAEPALIDLWEHVLDLGRGPILLIALARPELEEARADWLARPTLHLVRLDALDASDAATLLDLLAPDLPPGAMRSGILAAAEGNPLFVEQFVAYASDAARGGPPLTGRDAAALPIPSTIGALLAARLDRLLDAERRTLERAAVIGRTFGAAALAELLPAGERPDLGRRLAQLARRDLIRPEHSSVSDDEAYRFRHLLIRDAAYAALPKRDRAELHEAFAGWQQHRSDRRRDSDLILGYHLEQAYRYRLELGDEEVAARPLADRALSMIAPAGQAALERGDPHAAASLLRRAVDLAPEGSQRVGLLIDLRSALWELGEREASDAADIEVLDLLAKQPDEGLMHRRYLAEVQFGGIPTTPDGGAAYAYYVRVGDRLGMVHALEAELMHKYNTGMITFAVALELLERATALALEVGGPALAGDVTAKMAWMLIDSPVSVPECLDRLHRYLDLAADNRQSRALILLMIGQFEARGGVRDTWRDQFDRAKAIIDDLGLSFMSVSHYPMILGDAELAAGDPARTVELLRQSCSTLDRLGSRGILASIAPLTAQTLLEVGHLDEVEDYASWGRVLAGSDDIDAQSRWRNALSGLRTHAGRHDEAVVLARESVALLLPSDFQFSLGLAHLALARALRGAGHEAAARGSANDADRIAAALQDQSTQRKVAVFLSLGS